MATANTKRAYNKNANGNYKRNEAYYIGMSDAVGKVERISKSQARDEAGNLVQTNSKVVNVGVGRIGAPRKIKTGEEFINAFTDFTDYIRESDFALYPTKRQFALFTGLCYSTIHDYLNKYYSEKQIQYKDLLADILTEGVNSGRYDRQMTIFCLKNWSGWADRSETVTTAKAEPVTKEQADKLIKQYIDNLPKAD